MDYNVVSKYYIAIETKVYDLYKDCPENMDKSISKDDLLRHKEKLDDEGCIYDGYLVFSVDILSRKRVTNDKHILYECPVYRYFLPNRSEIVRTNIRIDSKKVLDVLKMEMEYVFRDDGHFSIYVSCFSETAENYLNSLLFIEKQK